MAIYVKDDRKTMTETLDKAIEVIKDSTIREFTRLVLSKAPATFWVKPASSTGKYHNEQSSGPGGLVRHTLLVMWWADHLCTMHDVPEQERDIILAAAAAHDIIKYGFAAESKWTTKTHDIDAAKFVRAIAKFYPKIDPKIVEEIASCCEAHMGRWRSDKTITNFDQELTRAQKIVHTADYASSRQKVSVDIFDEAPLIG